MAKSKKVRMPAGIRNKLTAAIAMLLVSSIMMVSSTYAWFTLSTAPEVTGITTSVGANGNLEMALLNTETYNDLSKIASAVGNSSAATGDVTVSNITWGNLVDLSAAGYGLQNINLQPARLNMAAGANGVASLTSLLQMPVYGKDGRVSELSDKTYSAVYNNGWAFDADNQTYGVRAIGANDNLSPQEAGLIAAKTAYSANLKSAQSALQSALSANGNELVSAITALAMGKEMSTEQQTVIGSMISASNSALNYIDAAYKQVLLAYASLLSDATLYSTVSTAIAEAASYNDAVDAVAALNGEGDFSIPGFLTTAAGALAQQKGYVAQAQTDFDGDNYTAALGALVNTSEVTINGFTSEQIKDGDGINGDFITAVITGGGAVVEMPDDSGVFAYVASVAGNYSASCLVNVQVSEGQSFDNLPATMKTTATVDTSVSIPLNALQAAASTSAATVLSDTFGYALDFAFRTNAAESYLLLQTAAAQRVYSDSQSAATQGAGATMTFSVTTTEAGVATLTNDQVKHLMGAIRVGFINPLTSDILGIAALTNIAEGADGFKGELYLHNYTVETSGVMTLNGVKTEGPAAGVDPAAIMKLNQSEAARLTVVVWLDGDMVDNADVANAAQSLVGSMNLQFSSSAELIPMQNTALQNMTITYTEMDNADYAAGLYLYNNTWNVLKDGYKLYNGSDRTLYFSNDETNYTKLTVMNYTTAMTPLTVSVEGAASIVEGAEATLTAKTSAGTIKSVTWTSGKTEVATVDPDDVTTDAVVDVLGVAAGTAEITATVAVEFDGADGAKIEKPATVKFNVTVTEPVVEEPTPEEGGEEEPVVTTFSVTYVGGEDVTGNVPTDSTAYTENAEVTVLGQGDLQKDGFTFGGWSDGNGHTYQESDTFEITANTTLTAVWNSANS